MSGQGKYRDLWEHYFVDSDAIIFVIDSVDKLRISVVKDELDMILSHKTLSSLSTPILFYANKMDLEGGMSPTEISNAIGLENIKDRNWTICSTNALSGQGVEGGLNWLIDQLQKLWRFDEIWWENL